MQRKPANGRASRGQPGRRWLSPRRVAPCAAVAALLWTLPALAGVWSDQVTERLVRLHDAEQSGDRSRFDRIAANGEAGFDGAGRLRVQLDLAPGVLPSAIRDADLTPLGGAVAVRGIDVVDVWLPLPRLPDLVRRLGARLLVARLPFRPTPLVGPTESQGAAQVVPPASVACTGNDGSGVTVVVLDAGFEKWDEGVASGELPKTVGSVGNVGGTHGTMCGEVIADVAPGASLYPLNGSTFAAVQKMVADIESGKLDAQVVSHSVIWFGMSFGRHEGAVCKLTDKARKAGLAWVNAAGNSGGGNFWTGVWTDADKDGHQDFGPAAAAGGNINYLRFRQYGGQIKLALDWDDYTKRETDLDLHLYRETDKGLEFISSSAQQNGIFVAPFEQIVVNKPASGVYIAVIAGKKTRPNLRLRLVNLGGGSQSFSVWHGAGNVYDPASCEGVLTVGAVPTGQWDKGTLASYSSYGPLVDGRNKPEIVGPTSVKTSLGNFGGTSCACPHVAGVVALAMAVTSASADDVVAAILAAADPIAPAVPHPASGYGRAQLDAILAGEQCVAGETGLACSSACGSAGSTHCSATCRLQSCVAPQESCGNGQDDDCDGETDEACPGTDAGSADAAADAGAEDGVQSDGTTAGAADVGAATDAQSADASPAGGAPRAADDGCMATPGRPRERSAAPLFALVFAAGLLLGRRRYRTKT